ncbi:hypothetical protein LXL04_006864 [Taraxacum kok-saghyz]
MELVCSEFATKYPLWNYSVVKLLRNCYELRQLYLFNTSRFVPPFGTGSITPVSELTRETGLSNNLLPTSTKAFKFVVVATSTDATSPVKGFKDNIVMENDQVSTRLLERIYQWGRTVVDHPSKCTPFCRRFGVKSRRFMGYAKDINDARLNRLPTRVNLQRRGMCLPSPNCPWCHTVEESAQHIFAECRSAKELLALTASWCTSITFPPSIIGIDDILIQQRHSKNSKKAEIWEVVSRVFLWTLWNYRNGMVFEGSVKTNTQLLLEIKLVAYNWIRSRSLNFKHVIWLNWFSDPTFFKPPYRIISSDSTINQVKLPIAVLKVISRKVLENDTRDDTSDASTINRKYGYEISDTWVRPHLNVGRISQILL